MALTLESIIKYIPKFSSELTKYKAGKNETPLTFHIKAMGALAFRAFAAKLALLNDEKSDAEFNAEVNTLYREIIVNHVIKIENLSVDGVPILTGEVFYDHPAMPNALVHEIEKAIVGMNQIDEEEGKN